MTKRTKLLIMGLAAFLATFAVLRLSGLSLWVSLFGAGVTTAAMLSALMRAGRGKGQLFQTQRQAGIYLFLLGLGIVAMSIFVWSTTQLKAIAVIGLISGIGTIAGGVFGMIQGGRMDGKPAMSSLADQGVGERESSPR